ncbi:hypothetical protein AFLA70_729g000230 [Aspergillus flavus AF70]|nr:hypothetical protein AFLA70_729g000230 [Aspergillus flavus AF70]
MTNKQPEANIYAHASFDLTALLSIARAIRQKNCTCDESQRPKSGSLNWAIFVVFEDGVEWVFRSPRKAFGLEARTATEALLSEVATLEYLAKNGCIPIPRVFSYCSTGKNDIGIPYILMGKATGVPLSTYKWDDDKIHSTGPDCEQDPAVLTFSQKAKIVKQLGEIQAHLSNVRFDKVGSLFLKNGELVIEKCLYPSLVWQGRDEFDEQDIPRGPFTDAKSFYVALIRALFAHAKELPMEHHLFHGPVPVPQEYDNFQEYRTATDRWNDYVAIGLKTESTQNRLDYALVGMSLEDNVPLLVEKDNDIKCDGFPLCHPDLSCQNIFVDDELNITCIIDWAFASSVPPSMLLVCPGLPHPRDRIQPCLTKHFAEGFIAAKGYDGEKDLHFSDSSIFWTFVRLVNLDGLQDHVYFSEFMRSCIGQEVPPYIRKLRDRGEFKEFETILLAYEIDGEGPSKDEKNYFSCVGHERFTLSQHLTVMKEIDRDFVADKRLWKWMAQHLKERDVYMYPTNEDEKRGRKRKINEAL